MITFNNINFKPIANYTASNIGTISPISNSKKVSFGNTLNEDTFSCQYPYLKKGNPKDFSRENVVAVYCSSGTNGYDYAKELGKRIAESPQLGGVLTGGTVGLMEAVNRGCQEAGGYSIGVSEKSLEKYQPPNEYLDELHSTPNDDEREKFYNKRAAYTVILPGGPGTLKETFDQIVFLLKDKFFKKPEEREEKFQHQVILLETPETKGYWSELFAWMCKYPKQMSFYDKYLANITVATSIDDAMGKLEKGLDYDALKDKSRFNEETGKVVEDEAVKS